MPLLASLSSWLSNTVTVPLWAAIIGALCMAAAVVGLAAFVWFIWFFARLNKEVRHD